MTYAGTGGIYTRLVFYEGIALRLAEPAAVGAMSG